MGRIFIFRSIYDSHQAATIIFAFKIKRERKRKKRENGKEKKSAKYISVNTHSMVAGV